MDDIDLYAVFVIYPNGMIEKIKKDNRFFHMEYMVSLVNDSKKLTKLVKKNNIYLPEDDMEIKCTLTYELDITLPHSLTNEQKNILFDILSNYDMTECWFGVYSNEKIIDIEYDELSKMFNQKTK